MLGILIIKYIYIIIEINNNDNASNLKTCGILLQITIYIRLHIIL